MARTMGNTTMKSHLECIQQWYKYNCKGSVFLYTIDNPGWSFRVNIEQTDLEERSFNKVKINRDEHDWIVCWVEDNKFNGVGGSFNLNEILYFFRQWAISDIEASPTSIRYDHNTQWLQIWFQSNCNGDWEHNQRIDLKTLEKNTWSASISVEETELENKQFEVVEIQRSSEDWIKCWVSDNKFEGRGGCLNLSEILSYFRQWSKSYYE